jgi:hypothetical protein
MNALSAKFLLIALLVVAALAAICTWLCRRIWGQVWGGRLGPRPAAKQEARRSAELETPRRAEEEARRKAEAGEDARRNAEEEARRATEEEARILAQEDNRRKAEAGAQRNAEEEAQRASEDEARRLAEQEARREAEAEEEARRKAEVEARCAAEEEARRLAQQEARAKAEAEQEARRKAEDEARRAEEEARRLAQQEARAKAEAEREARPKAEDEGRCAAEKEEARLLAEQEARRKVEAGEEARQKAEEESLPTAGEEAIVGKADQPAPAMAGFPRTLPTPAMTAARPSAAEGAKVHRARPPAPEGRGGGQMQAEENAQPLGERNCVRSGPRLRLVCFRSDDRRWRIAVELPEDWSTGSAIQVSHDGELLQPCGPNESRWQLNRLSGSVEATEAPKGDQSWRLEIGPEEYLLFRLLEHSEAEEGRFVHVASRGEYLVICPAGWSMTKTPAIQPSREGNIGIEGYVGYRFHLGEDAHRRLEFRTPRGQPVAIQFRAAGFTLEGERAPAVFREYEAPLFLKSPPSVHSLDAASWAQVEKIVVGVAGSGRNKWRTGAKPNPANNEVQLSEHLTGSWGGWFFARLYDANEVLIDSLYFAFARPLRAISISGASLLPGGSGHGEARLEFEHDNCTIVEASSGGQRLEARAWAAGTVLTIPPSCEQVDWQIARPGEAPLSCTTRIERVWWSLGSDKQQPNDTGWEDKPVQARRADFAAASDKVLRIFLPCTKSLGELWVGFTRKSARPYRARAGQRSVSVRLGDFVGSEQLETVGCPAFSLWVSQNAQESRGDALRVKVDYECRFCGERFGTDAEALKHATAHESDFIQEVSCDEAQREGFDLRAFYWCGRWYRRHTENDYVQVGDLFRCPSDVWTQPSSRSLFIGKRVRDINESPFFSRLSPVKFARKAGEHQEIAAVRCSECLAVFCNPRAGEVGEHILQRHKSKLFSLV